MIKKIFKFIFKLVIYLIMSSLLVVILFKWVPVPITPLMIIRSIEQKQQGKEIILKHDWVSIDKISKNLQLAAICSEDQNFLSHKGFDLEAIEKAYEENKRGKRIKGASSITQQTAKNIFLWPQRSWLRKGLETYFTFLIELFWPKERILEVYLNSIEMGNGIYGAEAASQFWFKKKALKLTQYEASAIAAIFPNPRKYKANPASNFVEMRKNWIVNQMNLYGPFELEDN